MQITTLHEHKKLFEKHKNGEINLLIATDYFLNYFWTSGKARSILTSMGIPIKYEYIIGIIGAMRLITLLIACTSTAIYFKWWALLILPILIVLFGLFLNITARKKPNLFLGIITSGLGILTAVANMEKGLWFQIITISIPLIYFFMEFTQYITHLITSHLLLTNYNFFQFFQPQKGKFGHPFFYIEEKEE